MNKEIKINFKLYLRNKKYLRSLKKKIKFLRSSMTIDLSIQYRKALKEAINFSKHIYPLIFIFYIFMRKKRKRNS